MFKSYWKLSRRLFALCLVSLASLQPVLAKDLEARVDELEAKLEMMELKLSLFSDVHTPGTLESLIGAETGSTPTKQPIRTKAEVVKVLKIDETGEARRKDKLANFPEISTFVAWSSGHRDLINGLGVELFHDRDKPRRHSWMFKLMLADQWVGFSAGYILVPVINFNIGPFIAKDLEEDPITRDKETVWGIQASVFSF